MAIVITVAVSLITLPLQGPERDRAAGVIAVLLVAAGSPHGALDHLVVASRSRGPRRGTPGIRRWLPSWWRSPTQGMSARFVLVYVGVALAALAAYSLAPRAGFAAFLVVSVAHFAAGEAGVAVEGGVARGWHDPLAYASALGGVIVIVIPLTVADAGRALAQVNPDLAPVLTPLPQIALAVWIVWFLVILDCTMAALQGNVRARRVAIELGALMALCVFAHPLLAFGCYFAFWHALRHQARLAQLVRDVPTHARPALRGRPLREILLSALPGIPATIAVLALALVLATAGSSVLGALLAVIWALTVPHALVVAKLEWDAAMVAALRPR